MSDKYKEGRRERLGIKCEQDLNERDSEIRESGWERFFRTYNNKNDTENVLDFEALDDEIETIDIDSGRRSLNHLLIII